MRVERRGWRPRADQELLLRAALGGNDSVACWKEWLSAADPATLDLGSRRLLPLAWSTMSAKGVEEFPEFVLGAAPETWLENQVRFQQTAEVIAVLADAGVASLVLKGVALALLHYRDPALRPMSDVDVLVPFAEARNAIRVLTENGWRPARPSVESYIDYHHALEFTGPDGGLCDLHWRASWEVRRDILDEALWRAAVPLNVAGASTLALCATDQLVHVCAHAAAWNEMPTVRWVADAAMILEGAETAVDWARLIDSVRERGLALHLSDTLGYLIGLGVAIPREVLPALQSMATTPAHKRLYAIRTGPGELLRMIPTVAFWIDGWLASNEPLPQRAASFTRYLKSSWGMRRLWHLPYHLVAKCLRRVALAAKRR